MNGGCEKQVAAKRNCHPAEGCSHIGFEVSKLSPHSQEQQKHQEVGDFLGLRHRIGDTHACEPVFQPAKEPAVEIPLCVVDA